MTPLIKIYGTGKFLSPTYLKQLRFVLCENLFFVCFVIIFIERSFAIFLFFFFFANERFTNFLEQ